MNARVLIGDDGDVRARLDAHEARLGRVEERLRDADRESGVLASVDSSLTAVTNGQREILHALEQERQERRVQDLVQQKRIERATAMPLAIVTFFVGSVSGLDPKLTIAATVIAVAGAVFAPERLNREASRIRAQLAAAAAEAKKAEPPTPSEDDTLPGINGNGNGNGHTRKGS